MSEHIVSPRIYIAVFLSLTPFGFGFREQLFTSWVGLRGAVPIFLALFPYFAGIDQGRSYFNIAFFVVLISLLLQGWSIPWVARALGLALPPEPEAAPRLDVDLVRARPLDGDFRPRGHAVGIRQALAQQGRGGNEKRAGPPSPAGTAGVREAALGPIWTGRPFDRERARPPRTARPSHRSKALSQIFALSRERLDRHNSPSRPTTERR